MLAASPCVGRRLNQCAGMTTTLLTRQAGQRLPSGRRRHGNRESWREAIDAGWSIILTLTFRAGKQISFVAEC